MTQTSTRNHNPSASASRWVTSSRQWPAARGRCLRLRAGGRGNPQLARLGLAFEEILVVLVGLGDHLLGLGRVESTLAVAKAVDGLVVGRLVPAEPLADARDGAGVELLDVVDVVDGGGVLVLGVDGDDLPVELAV